MLLRRNGITTTETIVATAMLGIAVVTVGRFSATVGQGLRDRELSARIGWELVNLRETVGSWPLEKISSSSIESEPANIVSGLIENPRWDAKVVEVVKPAKAKRVTVKFVCKYRGQTAAPSELTFWVKDDQESESKPPLTSEPPSPKRQSAD